MNRCKSLDNNNKYNSVAMENVISAVTKRVNDVSVSLTDSLQLRPWSLSVSLVPTLLGSVLAYRSSASHQFNVLIFILTIFTVISVHGAANVMNNYNEYRKAIDNRKSKNRTSTNHFRFEKEIVSKAAILNTIGCVCFTLLSIVSPAKMEHLALVYFGGLSWSLLNTGSTGLKYIVLSDSLGLIIFGPIAVLFAFMAQTGAVIWSTIYFAIPLAINTKAILHSNHTCNAENDKAAGIVTLAIIIGRSASRLLYAILLFTPYIIFSVLTLKYSIRFVLPLLTLPHALKIEKLFRSDATLNCVPKQTAQLNFVLGILYVISCCNASDLPGLVLTSH